MRATTAPIIAQEVPVTDKLRPCADQRVRRAYPGAMTELDTRPVGEPELDDGDDERLSHFVRKEDILRSAIDGVPATALCGKKWLPGRDPEKYPVCPRCKEMMGMLESMQ